MWYEWIKKAIARLAHPCLGIAILSAMSCSFVLDYDECKTDQDCGGSEAVCQQGYCVDGVLTVNDLLTVQCTEIYGVPMEETLAETTILLGSILPFSGGLSAYGPQIYQGVQLAVDEINQAGGIFGKQLAVVSCDSGTDPEVANASARHLIDVVGVPAIIGPAASSVTIDVFTNTAKEAGVVMITPSATSTLLTSIQDNGYLWRTAPSDAIQGAAIAGYLLEQQEFERIAIVNLNDAYGNGLRDTITAPLCQGFDCLDKAKFYNRSYGEDTYSTEHSQIVQELIAFNPSVIVLIGFYDDGSNFLKTTIGQNLNRFVLSDGLKSEKLFDLNLPTNALCWLLGTQPASPTGAIYQGFALRFRARFGEDGAYSANAYDALYLLAYAIAAVNKDTNRLTGAEVLSGLKRLSSGTVVEAGSSQWSTAIQLLTADATTTINYEGASGPLNFDANGEATSDIEAWAMDLDDAEIVSKGVIYTAGGQYNGIQTPMPGEGQACADLEELD
ncbi:MAG: ABC transporter substrate-binding protein [Myxococcota bacterium]|nr:ABC transporter substrate-binding protein [Myxococcota bacterium]